LVISFSSLEPRFCSAVHLIVITRFFHLSRHCTYRSIAYLCSLQLGFKRHRVIAFEIPVGTLAPMRNPPDSRDAQAWEIYLAFLTGRTNGDKKLVRSAYKAADAFETVRAGHEESLKGRQRRA